MNSQELDRWFPNPSDLEVWEDIAAWFHEETGHLRPGKDKPAFFHQTPEGEPDCCEAAWLKWAEAKRADAIRSLLDEQKKMLQAFDDQTRELQIACGLMSDDQLTEFRRRAYPTLYP